MIKCPNCGSTAQVKLDHIEISPKGDWEWLSFYKCGCGAVIEQRVQVREQLTRYGDALIHYEYHY